MARAWLPQRLIFLRLPRCLFPLLSPRVDRIGLLVRKELPADYFGVQLPANVAKIQQTVVDFEQLDSSRDAFNGFPVAFSCLGSTRSKAGSKENFRHIDYDYNTHAAALAKAAGVRHFHLMSTTGADAKSSFHYLRTKGEIEENLRTQVQFPTLAVYRPGVLLTERPEKRWGEWFAQKLLPVFAPLLPEKNRAVHTLTVAEAMMQHAEHVLAVEEQRQQGDASPAAAAGAAPADAAAAAAPPAPTATIFENDEIRQLKVGRL